MLEDDPSKETLGNKEVLAPLSESARACEKLENAVSAFAKSLPLTSFVGEWSIKHGPGEPIALNGQKLIIALSNATSGPIFISARTQLAGILEKESAKEKKDASLENSILEVQELLNTIQHALWVISEKREEYLPVLQKFEKDEAVIYEAGELDPIAILKQLSEISEAMIAPLRTLKEKLSSIDELSKTLQS
jgi:hypothetical protein